MEQSAEEWLEEWADKNLQTPGFREQSTAMAFEAAQCRQDAKTDGVSEAALTMASGGSLEEYLLRQQNALTDAEITRLSDKD